jgi:hypothetical protein
MGIERKAARQLPKRLKSEILAKHERIGHWLGLQKVPLHELAWKETRLDLEGGDCYPLIDVLETMAEMVGKNTPTSKSTDPVTSEVPSMPICDCGKVCKSKAGLIAHKKKCKG